MLRWDSHKKTMKKLLLLDTDVICDLHTLGLFERIARTYNLYVTRTVFREAQYFKKDGIKYKIDIQADVTVIDDVGLDSLASVQTEAKEAQLGVDPGVNWNQ